MNAPAEKAADPPEKPYDRRLRAFLQARPLPGALVALAAYAVLPVTGLVVASREGPSAWTWPAWALLAGALLPALGILLRQGWAHHPAGWLGWAGLVGVVLHALSSGDIPAHIPAAAYGAFLIAAAGAVRTPSPAPAAQERRPDSLEQWVRENIEAIVIAFIMALVIRCFCIEVFKIPSSSMEPTLLGDGTSDHVAGCSHRNYHLERYPGGDRIMVTKFFYSLSDIQRYDVLVFKFPLNQPRNFIKRVVGLPDEELRIRGGNLFVRRPGEERFAVARRTLRTQDSVWIDLARGHDFFADPVAFTDYWKPVALEGAPGRAVDRVQDRELFTQEQNGNRGLRFEYKGRLQDGGYQEVGELRIAFEFELASPQGQVFAEIGNEHGRFELVLATDGSSRLDWTQHGAARPKTHQALEGFRLEMDRRYRLDLSVFDGMAYARVDGRVLGEIEYLKYHDAERPPPGGQVGIAFGSRDATFRARRLTVGRDLYYKGKEGIGEDQPVKIRPGHYVMMGDNVDSSHDSRSWKKVTFTLADGRKVECEAQEIGNTKEVNREDVMRRYGVDHDPHVFIAGDRNGMPWLLYRSPPGPLPGGLPVGVIAGKEEGESERFTQVDERYIVGKGLWIWWPPGRWFHLIR